MDKVVINDKTDSQLDLPLDFQEELEVTLDLNEGSHFDPEEFKALWATDRRLALFSVMTLLFGAICFLGCDAKPHIAVDLQIHGTSNRSSS